MHSILEVTFDNTWYDRCPMAHHVYGEKLTVSYPSNKMNIDSGK